MRLDTLSLMILSCVSISRDGEWSASRGTIFGVYVALVLLHGACAIFAAPIMPRIQTGCIYANVIVLVASVIALPVGRVKKTGNLNPGSYVFGQTENLTNWPAGWAFILSFMSPIWSIGFFDSCVHMSEEALHAAKAVPFGIIWSSGAACVLGFLVTSILAAVMDQNISHTLDTVFGQPMAQVSCCRTGHGDAADGLRYTLMLWASQVH